MFRFFSVLLAMVPLVCACSRPSGIVLGKVPKDALRTVIAVRAGETPPHVVLQGTLVEKCPAAGCWFYLQDATGVIKVDTKAAGFVVVNVPLQTQVTVAGNVVAEGEDVHLEGTGLRY
jgi:uncharacterized protein YdeI (BOF family)